MLLIVVFVLGYVAVVLEHPLALNKSASALIAGVLCWTVYVVQGDAAAGEAQLGHHLGELAGILFFLLGAMTIVELIDSYDGFELITSRITTLNRRRLLATVGVVSFVLSAILDNLTTSIVMMSFVRKLVPDEEDRKRFGGVVIIAANAGGVWSPMGDVTTTMLWVGGQITTTTIIAHLILPALVSVLVPLVWIGVGMRGNIVRAPVEPTPLDPTAAGGRRLVLAVGVGILLLVPVFKIVTHLPPFMGMLLGVGVLWAVTELMHRKRREVVAKRLSVADALQRIDTPSILFFLGILLGITALESAGHLRSLSHLLDESIGNVEVVTVAIGLASSVIDNVPLVAAAQGMYSLATYPVDHTFWVFLAYCAGTGGSILIIGSAAGIAVMGIQRISFGWYLRRMSLPALAGFAAGALTYLASSFAFGISG